MTGGENAFLDWLADQAPMREDVPIGIGDDCASIRLGDRELLITTDMLLDGTHFDSNKQTPEQIGRKAMACSLSDLAAMAARPVGAVVAVGLTTGSGIDPAKRMYEAMVRIAEAFDCPIVGGDTTSWPQPTSICVTMLGQCPPGRQPIRRSGAKPRDGIYVTGPLGGSILERHLTFEPRIELADHLAETCDPHAMMDISDGLAVDLSRICKASGVGAVLDETLLESVVSEAARELSNRDGITPLDHALHDGEDFELLVVMPEQNLSHEVSQRVIRVGTILERGMTLRCPDGTESPLAPSGYEHRL